MDKGADDDERNHEADDETDTDRAEADAAGVGEQFMAVLDEFERGRPDHRRDCEEEAELGGGAPLDAEAKRSHNRRARTADAGDHRQALSDAGADCRPDGQSGDSDHVRALGELFYDLYPE